jgi:transcriptional regulator with XRE-family HTH domain
MTDAERLHQAVGRRVRELRDHHQLTQERLAHEAGLHPVFVSRVERGVTGVTVDTVAALCGVMGVTLAEFFESSRQVPRLRGSRGRRRT